jgi:hypothetical protein
MTYCKYCDPKIYVIYGYCNICKRRCEPPPMRMFIDVREKEYKRFVREWNKNRDALVNVGKK